MIQSLPSRTSNSMSAYIPAPSLESATLSRLGNPINNKSSLILNPIANSTSYSTSVPARFSNDSIPPATISGISSSGSCHHLNRILRNVKLIDRIQLIVRWSHKLSSNVTVTNSSKRRKVRLVPLPCEGDQS